jgi:hypothetical protein
LVHEHGTDGDSPCSRALRELESEGFAEYLATLANAVHLLAVRARGGISQSDREKLLNEIRAVAGMLGGLNAIADEIERRVKVLKAGHQQDAASQSPLPQSVENALLAAEAAARAFISKLASQPIDFERHPTDSTLRWLRAAETERKRLMDAADGFAAVLAKFTDEHLEKAQRAGHNEARKLIEDILRVVENVRARRNLSNAIIRSTIASLQASLSLDDDALEASGRVQYMLQELEVRLEEAGIVVARQQERAEMLRRVRKPPKATLPEWTGLDAKGHDELRLLLAAFVGLLDEEPSSTFTKVQLEGRLQMLRPRDEDWSSWLHRRLQKAMRLGIVVSSKPDQNRRVAHRFSLSSAALKKYGVAARAFR